MTGSTLDPAYFDALYAADPDPWRFTTSVYEDDKYRATLAALPRRRYTDAVEIGCSIGVLTARLAERCDSLLATDVAQTALAAAAQRCAGLPVRFSLSLLPDSPPVGRFDLIMLSEVLYYFSARDLVRVAAACAAAAQPGADVMLVHWLGPTPDYPLTGDEAVAAFLAAAGWATVIRQERTPDYRLDLLRAAG